VEDGRIHPGRIEEYFEKAREELDQYLGEQGKEALFQLGIPDMHERLAHMVGQMRLRMSSGQNLLDHAVEVAKMAMYMGQAVDANVDVLKRAGILHEIGHLEEHADDVHPTLLAAQLAKRYGESPAVVACIAHLHPDHPSTSPEAHLLEAAEGLALSAPGIHKEGLERYIQHMEHIEKMVMGFKGVRKVYAMKAGRELLVLVDTEQVDDEYTIWIAKDISERIEHEVRFSGQVKIQVVRETRVTDYAT
jgi:ribonuclease Y